MYDYLIILLPFLSHRSFIFENRLLSILETDICAEFKHYSFPLIVDKILGSLIHYSQ